jgi:hypothetical protein
MHRLGDLVGGLARRRHLHAPRIGQVGAAQLFHLLRHGGREQHCLARRPQLRGDPAQRVDEAEVEHLVGLVEHELADRTQVHGARDPSGRSGGRASRQDVGAPREVLIWRPMDCPPTTVLTFRRVSRSGPAGFHRSG